MDNYPAPKLKLCRINRISLIAPSDKYEGKWVVDLNINGVEKDRFFVSEKQARSVVRVQQRPVAYCLLDFAPVKGPRFVFASDNKTWLCDTFGKGKEIPSLSLTEELKDSNNSKPVIPVGYTAQSFNEEDLPF